MTGSGGICELNLELAKRLPLAKVRKLCYVIMSFAFLH